MFKGNVNPLLLFLFIKCLSLLYNFSPGNCIINYLLAGNVIMLLLCQQNSSSLERHQDIQRERLSAKRKLTLKQKRSRLSSRIVIEEGHPDSENESIPDDILNNIVVSNEDAFNIVNAPAETEYMQETSERSKVNESETICPCADVSAGDIVFMVLSLGLRHGLTWEAQVDVMKMVNTIYGEVKVPETKYLYLKDVQAHKQVFDYHIFCPDCNFAIESKKDLKGSVDCKYCKSSIKCSEPANFFITIPLEYQLQKLMEDESVVFSLLNHRFTREKKRENALEDIYDGEVYQQHFRNYLFLLMEFHQGIQLGKLYGLFMLF
jgi:DNA-directed RNA polymerase subunit M/transcription elongation factor TFIIS